MKATIFLRMSNNRCFLYFILAILSINCLLAQSIIDSGLADIKGKVTESGSGGALEDVFVTLSGSDLFALTEKDGSFTIEEVPVGPAKLIFEVKDFQIKELELIIPSEGLEVSINLDRKKSANQNKRKLKKLSGQKVRQRRSRSSISILLDRKKNALVVQDAIGAKQISKSGDSDAGNAARRVTGATLVNNNLFIRGMGERYVTVLLGDSLVSSPDPDKRVVPLDIFPTSVIDSLVIQKTYSSDKPGEFGSGSINIDLKDYPEKQFLKVTLNTGFEFDTLGKPYLTYDGGGADFLGYDDGTRALPDIGNSILTVDTRSTNELNEQVRKFSPTFTTKNNSKAFPHYGGNFVYGDKLNLKNNGVLGYLFSISHKGSVDNLQKSNTFFDINREIAKQYGLNRSVRKSDLNAFFTMSFIPALSQKYKFTAFYSHKTKDTTQIETGKNTLDSFNYRKELLEFIQNDLIYAQFSGSHLNKNLNNSLIKWSAAYSLAIHYKPDARSAKYDDRNGNWRINDATDIVREFLENNEHSVHVKGEYQQPFSIWLSQIAKGYAGLGVLFKNRLVKQRRFQYEEGSSGDADSVFATDDPLNEILSGNNLVGFSTDRGFVFLKEDNKNDSYQGDLVILNAFLKIDLPILSYLNLSAGLNYEYSKLEIYDYNVWLSITNALLRDDVLTEHNLLPAANLVVSPTKNFKIRLSYSKSIARPDFREAVGIQYNLNEGGQSVYGNPDLVQSDIHSADLRFELYSHKEGIIALSGFYKHIDNPIELLQLNPPNPDELKYKYQNGEVALNYGLELEFSKTFERTIPLKQMYLEEYLGFTANFAYIWSEITVNNSSGSSYSQQDRPLQGQSPYVLNLLFFNGYDFKKRDKLIYGIDFNVSFNLVAPRIERVSLLASDGNPNPDVYEEPAPKLNFVLKNKFPWGNISLLLKNALDMPDKLFQGDEEIESVKMGSHLSLKVDATF